MLRTFEEWEKGLNHHKWDRIGVWSFPNKSNSSYRNVFYHYCGDTQKTRGLNSVYLSDRCDRCGEEVPEGIRMIVMLLSW